MKTFQNVFSNYLLKIHEIHIDSFTGLPIFTISDVRICDGLFKMCDFSSSEVIWNNYSYTLGWVFLLKNESFTMVKKHYAYGEVWMNS